MFSLFSIWRNTRSLDAGGTGGADRDQAVVHALLSAGDQVPRQPMPEDLHGRIVHALEHTQPETPSAGEVWLAGAGRAVASVAFLLALSGVVMWTTFEFGPSRPGSVVTQRIDADDLGAEVGVVMDAPRAAPKVEPVRPRTADWAEGNLSPRQSRELEQDVEAMGRTMLSALPVRQSEPR